MPKGARLEPLLPQLLPPPPRTRPCHGTKRAIIDGILYQLKNGCNWADLPKDLPPYSTVYGHYKQWREAEVIEPLMGVLYGQVREQVQQKPQWTTCLIMDSPAVKKPCNASVASKGFCFDQAIKGMTRHLAVETLGLPCCTHGTQASVADAAGWGERLMLYLDYCKSKPVKLTILLDHGYHLHWLVQALEAV